MAHLVPYLLSMAIHDWSEIAHSNFSPAIKSAYDYVIIGGGTAGSVLASRLSTGCLNCSVLVLEAGGSDSLYTSIPYLNTALKLNDTPLVRFYDIVPQRYCQPSNDVRCKVVTGNMLGGASSFNTMLATRGDPTDYDRWDIDGWRAKNIWPYFEQLERFEHERRCRGQTGPIPITTTQYWTEYFPLLARLATELKIPIGDYNQFGEKKFSLVQTNIEKGRRVSAKKGYLDPVLDRPNLDVLSFARVSRIIFKKLRATGVEFDHLFPNGKVLRRTVQARKEVILSAGTMNSPRILIQSGIGPIQQLRKLNISPISILSGVGQNLQNHLRFELLFSSNISKPISSETGYQRSDRNDPNDLSDFYLWRDQGLGPLSEVDYTSIGFSSNFLTKRGWIELTISPVFKNVSDRTFFLARYHLLRPKSRGSVSLDPNSPQILRIDPNYGDDRGDIKTLVASARTMINLVQSRSTLRALDLRPVIDDRCQHLRPFSDRYLECLIKLGSPTCHWVGTARMGSRRYRQSVVDRKLRVIGVENLRVVDASIMPKITSGHTHLPVIMIAEKAADLILGKSGPLEFCRKIEKL